VCSCPGWKSNRRAAFLVVGLLSLRYGTMSVPAKEGRGGGGTTVITCGAHAMEQKTRRVG
jgi:hypothetical protein